ncbi:sucrase [Ruficoccus amylovorans]|uniref:Sucrase n=1 Tax=Ruficoccus amylovorans TaxID=1804625 RepID=A0A842HHV0_9BACT|nr:glycoside hydrolase family protein [Ruficoccus amylovorans]MBC2595909.1 sucrase [Ruficoccus amylovorans]
MPHPKSPHTLVSQEPASRFSHCFEQGPLPYKESQIHRDPGWHVWCGALVRDPASARYHLFYSRWPADKGFDAWVTHSEIARAEGDSPTGPFRYAETLWPRDEAGRQWDDHCFHNVTVKHFGDKYYLYYMGNFGNGEWWTHRNNQRIGLAVASHPRGPWIRRDSPVLDVSPGAWDGLMVSNPTVTDTPDGRYLMIYKGVADGPTPLGGRVLHGLGLADSPEGPFVKHPTPIFNFDDSAFGFEDPCVWRENNTYFCIVKDMEGTLSPTRSSSLVLLQSGNGTDWIPSRPLHIIGKTLTDSTGRQLSFERVERPHIFIEPGAPPTLLVAIQPHDPHEPAFNIRLRF